MSSSLNVEIRMSADTVKNLQGKNFNLLAFRAVETSDDGGLPVVWSGRKDYAEITDVSWGETYGAFASYTKSKPRAQITVNCQKVINLGQKMVVLSPLQCQEPVNGHAGCISVLNNTKSEIPSCGIIERNNNNNNEFAPLCAFPLINGYVILIRPIQKVFLTFGNKAMVTKMAITESIGPGILIDMTKKPLRHVQYDANDGWIWNPREGSAEKYPAETKLAPHLIILSEGLKRAAKGML